MLCEKEIRGFSGWLLVLALMLGIVIGIAGLVLAVRSGCPLCLVFWCIFLATNGLCFAGLTIVNPNEAKVVTLFGVYKGSIKHSGLRWVNPLTTRRRVSLRIRNFESGKLKVNDRDGNPIEIAAIV